MAQKYLRLYDPAALDELCEWFKERLDRLPNTSLQLISGFVVDDVQFTVKLYLEIVEMHRENETFGAQILHLFRIREKLILQGFE